MKRFLVNFQIVFLVFMTFPPLQFTKNLGKTCCMSTHLINRLTRQPGGLGTRLTVVTASDWMLVSG